MAIILVFAPHNDDHALAMGGTVAKHYKAGDQVHTFVASYGEMSHPHLKPEVIRKIRVKEAQRADKVYGGDGRVVFLGLREGHFTEDFDRKNYKKTLAKRLKNLKPNRIYLPASNDLHPDHKSFSKLLQDILPKTEIYAYYAYPNFRHVKAPRMHVDVSDTYSKKIAAIHEFSSQIHVFTHAFSNNALYVYQLAKNWFSGFSHGTKFMEVFYRL